MNCINRAELELYLKGKLDIERLLAVDAHLSTCANCKTALQGLPAQQKAGAALGANLLGLQDCPEYESLSAYVDGTLNADAAAAVAVHANFCEECARDIARIEELRAHASMRETVEVFPGMSRQASRSVFGYWKQAAAILSGAVVIAAVALSMGQFGSNPGSGSQVANNNQPTQEQKNQPTSTNDQIADNSQNEQPVPAPDNSINNQKPESIGDSNADKTPSTQKPDTSISNKPEKQYATVLRDGKFSVTRRNGNYEIEKSDGAPVRTELEARIAASVREKLRTGKIKQAESYEVATTAFGVRDPEGSSISPLAPHLKSPLNKVLISNRPTLIWSETEMAESYLVIIVDEAGTPILQEVTRDNTFTPSKPLERGVVYKWRVGVRFGEDDEWAKSGAGVFSILSADDVNTINKLKAQGSHLALGAAYEYFGMMDEAAAEYRAVLKENPGTELRDKLTVKPHSK